MFQAGSGQNIPKARRDRLYRLTKQFKSLANGVYPLAMELSEDEEDLPKKINVAKVAKKAAEEEFRLMVKAREEKKKFQLELKEQQRAVTQAPPVEQEVKLVDESDNEEESESEEEEEVQTEKKKVKRDATGRRIHRKKNEKKDTTNEQIETASPKPASPKKKKNEKKKEVTNGDISKTDSDLPSPIKKPKNGEELNASVAETVTVSKTKKKKDKKKQTIQLNGDVPTEKVQTASLKIETTHKKPAEEKASKLPTPETNVESTPPKSKKKKNKNKSEQSPVPSSPLILSLTPEQKAAIKKSKEICSNDAATSTPINNSSDKKFKKSTEMSAAATMILNLVSEPKSKKSKKAAAAAREEENEQVITISKKRKNSEDEVFSRNKKSSTPMQRLVSTVTIWTLNAWNPDSSELTKN